MSKKEPDPKPARKTIVSRVVSVAKTARRSGKRVLTTGRTLPQPVEIEARPFNRPNTIAVQDLTKERERLLNELQHQEIVEQDHPTTGNHIADDAAEVEEQSKTLALRRHLEGMVEEIDRAIARAERGVYGVCERCKKPIGQERLKVMPSASLCIECAKSQCKSVRLAA